MNTHIIIDAITGPTGRILLAVIGLCLIGLAFGLYRLRKAHRHERSTNPVTDADGTATIEFALVFPILLFMMLVLSQTTFLMAGNIFVHYSAFAATRSAIVQIPTDYADDEPNIYTASFGSTKHDLIWRSAVFAVAPVSGEQTSSASSVQADQFVQGLRDFYQAYNRDAPAWVDNLAGDRLRYAADNTLITVMVPEVTGQTVSYSEISEGSTHEFQPRDPITVRVTHRYALDVPYVGAVYTDGRTAGGQRYHLMGARYTLTNEGVVDQLPPQPTVPRQDP